MAQISCIIAAYNEGPRIRDVLEKVSKHPLIDEVIVINDGSTDTTREVLEKYPGIKVISQYPNTGKTRSVMKGIEASKNEIIMLLDADLIGLTEDDVSNLAAPVISGKVDVTISIRKNSLAIYKSVGIDFCSGERVFYRSMLGDITQLATLPKFGLEVYMNNIIIKNHLRIKIVRWNGVSHARKSEKMGWLQGNIKEIKMVYQVLRTLSVFNIVSQTMHLKDLQVKG